MGKKTVFVIGAGASKEFDLPTGYELKNIIKSHLRLNFDELNRLESGDNKIFIALINYAKEQKENVHVYFNSARQISNALTQAISIDHFVDAHREDKKIAFCSKLAIVRSILHAEKNSSLYFNRLNSEMNFNSDRLEQTWLTPFFQLVTENCSKNELKERFQSIEFIVFNYDRCIEHYLYFALQNYYRIPKEEAAELINEIAFFHPYGSVGFLPWSGKSNTIEFGHSPSPIKFLEIATMIKTFTEGTDPDSSEIKQMRYQVQIADRLVFLGFAFHPLNLKILKPDLRDKLDMTPKTCYATTYGISESDKEIISYQLDDLCFTRIETKMVNKKCYDFFDEFRRSLSFT